MAGNKFIPKFLYDRPGFTYSACGPFIKHCERIKKLKKTPGDLNYIYRKELYKACFANDAGYSDGNDLAKRTI